MLPVTFFQTDIQTIYRQLHVSLHVSHIRTACLTYRINSNLITLPITMRGPPLWYSGQSSWLQIQRPGFDSRHYQKKNVVGLERGPLSLVSTN
jgi:hypothetical protein